MPKSHLPDLRKSSGAFDLPSITTGVIVVGILVAGVLAAIFGVMPFAQDRGAKQDLSSIRTAEGVAKAKDNRFMDHAGLLDTGYLQESSTEKTKVAADEKGTCYVALAKSSTGKVFYSTDTRTEPELFEAGTDPGCLPAEKLDELIEEVGGIESETPSVGDTPATPAEGETPTEDGSPSTPAAPPVADAPMGAPANLKLTAVSAIEAKATWNSVKKATGYKVEYQINGGEWATKSENTTVTSTSINALPEDTIIVRIYALQGEDIAGPSTATVKLPDSVLTNPGFENDLLGWTLETTHNTGVSTSYKHSGSKSGYTYNTISQVVTVPEEAPVLTFWSNGSPAAVKAGGVTARTARTQAAAENGFYQYSADLSAYAGKTVTVSFETGSYFLDDVAFEKPMAPSAPQSVTALSKSGTATVSWTAPVFTGGGIPVSSYTAVAMADGVQVASVKVAGDQLDAVFTGLEAGTGYSFKVRATNEAGTSPDSAVFGPVAFNTDAFTNPGFENDLLGWTLETTHNTGVSTSYKHSGSKSGYTYNTISQVVTVPEEAPVLTFWSYGSPAAVKAGGVTARTARTQAAAENGFTQYSTDLSAHAGKTVTVSFETGSYFLDDVAFEKPMAPSAPQSVTALSKSGTATVSWTAPVFTGGGIPVSSYTAVAMADGVEVASVKVAGDQLDAVFTGLEAGTAYSFKVRATNEAGTSPDSAVFGPVAFNTGAFTNPGFENDWLGWTRTNTSNSGISTSYKHSGAKSAYAYYGMSQEVTVPAESPVLTLWSRVTAPGVLVNGANMPTAVTAAAAENGFTQYSADLSAYAGKTVSVTFNTSFSELDDVAFEKPMAPSAPQSVTALSKSGTATVSWTAPVFTGGGIPVSSYTATAWTGGVQVASVKVAGDQLAAVFTGLEAGTGYSFKVRATNEAGTSPDSAAFGPVAFNTGAFTNPGFENDWLGWTRTNTSISGISTSYKHSGAKSAYAYHGMSQVVTVPAESPVLTFWSRVTAPGVSVNGANMSTPGTAAAAENGFTQYSADLSAYAGKTVSVTFNTSGNELDDVAFEGPMAPSAPQSVTALSKSGTATVSWKSPVFTGGGIPVSSYTATAWTGGVQVASVKVAGDQLAAVFTGLEAGTEYSFKVRATNEAGTSPDSAAFGPVAFNTGAFTNPGFENGTLGWSLSTSSSRATTSYRHSGTASLEPGYINHWVSQTVAVPEATPVLTLWGRSSAPVVRVGTTQVPAVLTAAAAENGFNQYSADLSAYAGKTVAVGLASNYYLDDVAFEGPMAPSAPQSVTALSKSGTATVSWARPVFTGGGIPLSSYTAVAMADGVQVASVKVAGDQLAAVFTGLEAGTGYTFKVRATNEAGTSADSAVFGPVAFNTGAFTNPGFENGTLGWSLSTSASRATTSYKHSGTASLESGYTSNWVSQTVTVPEEAPVLTLWGRSAVPVVRVGTTQVPAVLTQAAVENGFNQYSADLSAYAGKTVTVGLASNWYIDDVAFEKPMAPSAPQSVTALSKSGTATVSWARPVFTGGGIPISSYTAVAMADGVQVASVKVAGDQLAAVFTGLEAGTGYTFKVRATNEAGTSADSAVFGPVAFNTGAFTNPGFENGTLGWSLSTSSSRATTSYRHSGTASLEPGYINHWVSQTVTVPEEAPVLTLWGRSAVPVVRVGTTQVPAVLTQAAAENGFNQYSADLSAYAGKTVTVGLASNWYIDDVAFE